MKVIVQVAVYCLQVLRHPSADESQVCVHHSAGSTGDSVCMGRRLCPRRTHHRRPGKTLRTLAAMPGAGADLGILRGGGGGGRVQVHGNFHILTSTTKPGGGLTPPPPPWIRHCAIYWNFNPNSRP